MSKNIYKGVCPKCQKTFTKEIKWKHIPAFCSRACANSRSHSIETKKKMSSHALLNPAGFVADRTKSFRYKKDAIYPYTKIRCCPLTGLYFKALGNRKYHPNADLSIIALYRRHCKFNISQKNHPRLFKVELIEKYGWYMPASTQNPNLQGVCWDHLYRIEDGFANNITIEVMRHPANAEMVTWPENKARIVSQITLDQLLERIQNWSEL